MMSITFRLFSRKINAEIPARLWGRILAAHDGDEELASIALATAVLVAAENIAVPHRPKKAPILPPFVCATCGHCHEPPVSGRAALEREQTPQAGRSDGIEVDEQSLPGGVDPADPWKTARD